jgi:hypothetical protein
MLVSLKNEAVGQRPSLASGRAVVGNFSEEGQPFAGALGAVLQERVDSIVRTDALFAPPARQTRGITVKEVAAVQNPNDPKSAAAVYGGDLAIGGTYRVQGDQVVVRLSATDAGGAALAQAAQAIPAQSLPAPLQEAPVNAADTGQLLSALERLGPKAQGTARVEVTTNQPGAGATFRMGEEIRYLVTSTTPGYLYLFHVDAEKSVTRIFPNEYQREARLQGGAALEVPAAGAPFKFEASPPFGLETTVALVTASPLGEADLQLIATTLARPSQQGMAATRGIAVKASGPTGAGGSPAAAGGAGPPGLVWNSVTVLVRP